jgi:predicted proteasome-type protease
VRVVVEEVDGRKPHHLDLFVAFASGSFVATTTSTSYFVLGVGLIKKPAASSLPANLTKKLNLNKINLIFHHKK